MPLAIVLLVSFVFYNEVIVKEETPIKEIVTEIVVPKQTESKPVAEVPESTKEVSKNEIKKIEPIKEEVKIEPKKIETVNEKIKTEVKQTEVVQEEIKEEPNAELEKALKEDAKIDEPENNYLKIILYIIGAIATIFGGFYFFSNRGGQSLTSVDNNNRNDIEENTQPQTQAQKSTQEDIQQSTQDLPTKEDAPVTPEEQDLPTEENVSETTEDQSSNDDENNSR